MVGRASFVASCAGCYSIESPKVSKFVGDRAHTIPTVQRERYFPWTRSVASTRSRSSRSSRADTMSWGCAGPEARSQELVDEMMHEGSVTAN